MQLQSMIWPFHHSLDVSMGPFQVVRSHAFCPGALRDGGSQRTKTGDQKFSTIAKARAMPIYAIRSSPLLPL